MLPWFLLERKRPSYHDLNNDLEWPMTPLLEVKYIMVKLLDEWRRDGLPGGFLYFIWQGSSIRFFFGCENSEKQLICPIPFPGFDRFYLRLFRVLVCILENCGLYLVSIFEKSGLYLVCNTHCSCQHWITQIEIPCFHPNPIPLVMNVTLYRFDMIRLLDRPPSCHWSPSFQHIHPGSTIIYWRWVHHKLLKVPPEATYAYYI